MSIVEFYRIDQNNPGDWYSNPARYFFSNSPTIKVDIDNVRKTTWNQRDPLIVGGGGLIGNNNFESLMERITVHPDELILTDILNTKLKNVSLENRSMILNWKTDTQISIVNLLSKLNRSIGPRVLWGAGYNSKDELNDSFTVTYPNYLNRFHLVGVRDWGTDYTWVPCASCMHPAFDKEYQVKNEIVWFEHKKQLLNTKCFDMLPAPRMINSGQNIEQIIEFLGSANIVVTNSYHGVYWATLLGKGVVCIPWGDKFNMFKHPPIMATEKNWVDNLDKVRIYKDALDECRDANITFFNQVSALINNHQTNSASLHKAMDDDEIDQYIETYIKKW